MRTGERSCSPAQKIINFFSALLDWFFPPLCSICGEKAGHYPFLCESCFQSLPLFAGQPDTAMLHEKNPAEQVICMYLFDDRVQRLVHLLKYGDMPYVGEYLGRHIGELLKHSEYPDCDALLPVPLHPLKKRERGYNQAFHIAKGISAVWKIPVDVKLVKRIKYTGSQTKLNRLERRENMHDAFYLRKNIKVPQSLCIIDDVFTTGATTLAVAELLKTAGVKKIRILTLATPPKDQ